MLSGERGAPLYRDWRGLAARWGLLSIVVGMFGVLLPYLAFAEFWEDLWFVVVGFVIAFVVLAAWLVRGTLRDVIPLAVYPTGIDIPEEWVFAREWDEPGTVKKSSGFHPFADVAWYFTDNARPWIRTKIGLRSGGLIVIPESRPSRRPAFLAALAAFVRRAIEDPDAASVMEVLDTRPEAYDSMWHWNPRRPLPTFWVGLGFIGALVVWFPFVFLRAWSLLPAFVAASGGFALWLVLGTRYLIKREVRCLTLVDPGKDRVWAFLERSWAGLGGGVRLTEERASRLSARRTYALGDLTILVDKLWGEVDPWIQWRVVVEGPDEDAVQSARRAIARAAIQEGLLPTSDFHVQVELDDIREPS